MSLSLLSFVLVELVSDCLTFTDVGNCQKLGRPGRRAEMQIIAGVLLAFLSPMTIVTASSPTPASITVPGYFSNFKEAIEKCTAETTSIIVQPGCEFFWFCHLLL